MTSDEIEERDRVIAAKDVEIEALRDSDASWFAVAMNEKKVSAHLRAQLAALEARYAADMEVFKSGAHEQGKVAEGLREAKLMAEAVRDSMAARLGEVCDALLAERVAHAAYDEDGGDELMFTWANARQLTDAMVAKHAGSGVGAPKFDDDSILTMLSDIDTICRDYDHYTWGVPVNSTPEVDAAMCEAVRKWLMGA